MRLNEKVDVTFRQLIDDVGLSIEGTTLEKIYNLHLRNECNKPAEENIYLCTEQLMNGTVTIQISTTLIKASSFKEAVNKIKNNIKALSVTSSISIDTENSFQYTINNEFSDVLLVVFGTIENKLPRII